MTPPPPDAPRCLEIAAPRVRFGPAEAFRHASAPDLAAWISGAPWGAPRADDAARLLDAWRLDGQAAARRLPGRFACVVHERALRRVTVCTDRLAGGPLYLRRGPDGLALAETLDFGVRAGLFEPRIDPVGLRQVLTLSYCVGGRTVLEGVERAAAGCTWVVTEQGVEATSWWRPEDRLSQPKRRAREAVDEAVEALRIGVERSLGDASAADLTVSGGLDSRVLLAAVIASGRSATAWTIAVPGGRDERFARALCERLGARHRVVHLGHAACSDDLLRESSALLDGMSLVDAKPVRELVHAFGATPPRAILHGALGELAKLENAHEFEVKRGGRGDFAGGLASRYAWAERALAGAWGPELARAPSALDALRAEIAPVAAQLPPLDAVTALYIRLHFHGFGVPGARLYGATRVAWPYADADYVDTILGIAAADRIRPRVHLAALRRFDRRALRVRDSNTGVLPGAPEVVRAAGRFASKVAARLNIARVGGHDAYESTANNVSPVLGGALRSGALVGAGLLDVRGIDGLVSAAKGGSGQAAALVQRLHIMELWAGSLER